MEKIKIEGKRPAPNSMYWANILIGNKGKAVMVEPLDNETFRAWSNSTLILGLPGWELSENRKGWTYKDMPIDKFTIFDWN